MPHRSPRSLNLKERWVRIERLKGSKVTVQPLERHPGQPLLPPAGSAFYGISFT
jgi:hypothetical protein